MSERMSRAHTATLRHLRVAPRKARVVVDMIRERPVDEALDLLKNCDRDVAVNVYKLLDSALSNVQQSDLDWDVDRLYVARAFVDEGPTMRRFRARAQGRAARINKRTSHITIELDEF
jgi:large subunit ribosomal protein L22